MSASAIVGAFIRGVESLRTLNERVAKEAEKDVLAAARETAAEGAAPDGTAWLPRADGGKPLEGAASAIESSSKGPQIQLRVGKPHVFHQHGAGGTSTTKDAIRARRASEARRAKGGFRSKFHAPRRQIIPKPGDPIPEPIKRAIAAVVARVFGRAVG
jgi:hypothetical protein